ncbi:hypothetical protein D9M72_490490 [compost metagenome]
MPIERLRDGLTDDEVGQSLARNLSHRKRSFDLLAAPQHRDRVGDAQHLADLVQDEDNCDPTFLETANACEQHVDARR